MQRSDFRLLNGFAVAYLIFLYAPVLLLPLFSLNDSTVVTFPLRGFTWRWYEAVFADQSLLAGLWASLRVAIPVAVISTGLGLLAAIALTRTPLPAKGAILAFIMLPLIVPPLILGIALLTLARKVLDLELSLWTIGAGHVLLCLPYSILVLMARLEGFDRSLEEASLDLGQGPLQTFRRITLPLAMPAIVSSLLLATVVSFDEFLIAFFLSGTEPTLPIAIWGSLRFPAKLPVTLALGSMVLCVSAAVVVFAELYRRRGIPEASQADVA